MTDKMPTPHGPEKVLAQVHGDHNWVETRRLGRRPFVKCTKPLHREPLCEREGTTPQEHREYVAAEQFAALGEAGWIVIPRAARDGKFPTFAEDVATLRGWSRSAPSPLDRDALARTLDAIDAWVTRTQPEDTVETKVG